MFRSLRRIDRLNEFQDELSTPLHLLPAWRFAEALASNCPLVLVVAATKCLPALVFSEICMAAK